LKRRTQPKPAAKAISVSDRSVSLISCFAFCTRLVAATWLGLAPVWRMKRRSTWRDPAPSAAPDRLRTLDPESLPQSCAFRVPPSSPCPSTLAIPALLPADGEDRAESCPLRGRRRRVERDVFGACGAHGAHRTAVDARRAHAREEETVEGTIACKSRPVARRPIKARRKRLQFRRNRCHAGSLIPAGLPRVAEIGLDRGMTSDSSQHVSLLLMIVNVQNGNHNEQRKRRDDVRSLQRRQGAYQCCPRNLGF
jgi:hypothetical protein